MSNSTQGSIFSPRTAFPTENSTGILPPELLDRIIDHLHDDRPTLRTLALVSRQTFVRSRIQLALNFEFAEEDWKFDLFLERMDVPVSSLSYAIQSLHLRRMFHASSGFQIMRQDGDASRIADNLPNVRTLKLTSIVWHSTGIIPTYVRDLFFLLRIAHLHLNDVKFFKKDFVAFFARLQSSIKTITMLRTRLHSGDIPTVESSGAAFARPFHFRVLDTHSLLHFQKVWDPLTTEVTVESFILRLCHLFNTGESVNTAFISRFLHRVGPSLRHLYINIADSIGGDPYSLEHLAGVDVSQCTNLRILHIGTIEMDHLARPGEAHEDFMFMAIWALLDKMSSSSHPLEEINVLFKPFGDYASENIPGKVAEIESFEWSSFVARLQSMFPNLKAIRCAVGYYTFHEGEDTSYHDAFKRAPGSQELLDKGIMSFHTVPWAQYESPDPTWRSIPTFETPRGDATYCFGDF